MKKAKSTGALVVSLVLAASMLLVGVIGISTVGVTTYKAVKGETAFEEPMGGDSFETDGFDDSAEDVYAEIVLLDIMTRNDKECAVVTGYLDGGMLWEYLYMHPGISEPGMLQEIAWHNDMYIFNADGTIVALDTRSGEELWTNSDFGGHSIAFDIDEDRTMYLCGYHGPDLCVIDINGNTLERVERFDADHYGPYEVVKNPTDSSVKVTFEQGPAGGNASVLYNLDAHSFYQFDGELTLAGELETWKSIFMSHKLDDRMKDYYIYSLVHMDQDGIPEMIGYGDDCSVVLKYIPSTDEVKVQTFTGQVGYYPGTGVFDISEFRYEDNVSENTTTYFIFTESGYEELGTLWYKSYPDETGAYQYEYKYNDEAVDEDVYYDRVVEVEDRTGYYASVWPKMYSSKEIDEQILSWGDASDDEMTWKQIFRDELEYRSGYDGYRLTDVNGDGIPELFIYKMDEYDGSGYLMVCDVQTHQLDERYISAEGARFLPGTGKVVETMDYDSSASDMRYQVDSYRIVQTGNGYRILYPDRTEYYMGERAVSAEAYAREFPAGGDGFEYLHADCVSYEEIMSQLQ